MRSLVFIAEAPLARGVDRQRATALPRLSMRQSGRCCKPERASASQPLAEK